jgi:putative transposase
MLTANSGHRHTTFGLAQDRKDLGFCVSACLYKKIASCILPRKTYFRSPLLSGRGGLPLDHIVIERLWRSLKQEAIYLHEIIDGFQAKRIIDDWVGFYNSESPHTALDKRTPETAYSSQTEALKAA